MDTIKPNEDKVYSKRIGKDEYAKEAESAYQQIVDLIERFQKIDAAIVASNAETEITTSYKYDFAMSGLGKKSKILAKIKHFFKCVKWSKQRITRGYCDCDVWEMFSFLQTLIPDMLQTLKDTRTGSPGYLGENYTNENGILVNDTCHEEWNCILDKMIFLWREAEKDTCSQKNPFDEAHSKAMDEFTERFGLFGNKLQTEKELEENRKRGGGGTIHFMDELPEYKEISDKYREEEKRLEEYRRKCKDEAIDMLKQYFYDLWD